jgi:hypothetical protein
MLTCIYQPNEVIQSKLIKSKGFYKFQEILEVLDEEFDWESKKQEILALDYSFPVPETLIDLPSSEVAIGRTIYKIHGFVHNVADKKISDHVMMFLREQCEAYHTSQTEDYLCEQWVGECFGLGNMVNDATRFPYQLKPNFAEGLLQSLSYLGQLPKQKTRIIEIYNKNALLALDFPQYLPRLRTIHYARIQAPPLTIADPVSYLEKLHEIRRSRYMARYLKHFAKRKNLSTLHCIVGLEHEPHVATYLRIPNYPAMFILANIYPRDVI